MKRVARQIAILNGSSSRTPFCGILSRSYSTQQGEEKVIKMVPKEKKEKTIDAQEVATEVVAEAPQAKNFVSLTRNSELFPSQFSTAQRTFNGYIQPGHYKLTESQLLSEFSNQMEVVAAPIFGIEPSVLSLEMGTNKLKFQILKASMKHFGREIPISEIPKLRTVRDVAAFFAKQVVAEVPAPEFKVPKNVSLFIKEHAKKREILVREQMVKMIGERKRKSVQRQVKSYFPGPSPQLTPEEVEFYLKVFRRNADDKIFKKKLIKKHNPRKLYDTRIDYDRPTNGETEELFHKKFESQV